MNVAIPMQVADSPRASRTSGVAELMQQLNVADADIVLVNKRLDESQGKRALRSCFIKRVEALL